MIDVNDLTSISTDCSMTEFVGTTVLDTIGLVIPGIDPALLEQMGLKNRTGAWGSSAPAPAPPARSTRRMRR